MNIEASIKDFLEYIEITKGRSLKTITNYAHYLERFALFAGKRRLFPISNR